MSDFRELEVWKKAHQLTIKIYKISSKLPEAEKFGLNSQIKRAAVSVESNIAEGNTRYSSIENVRFFDISRASIAEVVTQLLIISDIFVDLATESSEIISEYEALGKQLTNLIKFRASSKPNEPNKPIKPIKPIEAQ